jgi:hypothetical protein
MVEHQDKILCKQCFDKSLKYSAKVKKVALFTSLTAILTTIIFITFVILFFDFEKPHGNIAEKTGVNSWPFITKIPAGFKFEQRLMWEGRTFWILKGSQFGRARKTIIVVRSTPQTYSDDIMKAPYWAAELSVGLSIGETQRGQKGINKDEVIKTSFYPFDPQVILFSPTGKKKKEPQNRTSGGIMSPPTLGIPDTTPTILLVELGKPEDFVPGGLSAWAGWSNGTLLLAACASEAGDFSFTYGGQYGRILAELCHNLCFEPGEKYEPPDNKMIESLNSGE